MIRAYTRMIGKPFAHEVLGDLMDEIVTYDYHFEIDRNKFDPEEQGNCF